MDILNKFEEFINALILRIGAKLLSLVPVKLRVFFETLPETIAKLIAFIKTLPALIKSKVPGLKAYALNFNYKETIAIPLKEALSKYNSGQKEKAGQLKILFLAPFLLMSQWLKGLSVPQSLLLLVLTGGSVLSGIKIYSSSQVLMEGDTNSRTPASADDVSYDRPVYYKKDTKHASFSNIRLPVYVPGVNQIRSVDIDFTATMSTRESKVFLEKMEFQIRDHLVLEIEPFMASFPITDEGKEILRQKLSRELNQFLKDHKVGGEVEEIKIVYILAN